MEQRDYDAFTREFQRVHAALGTFKTSPTELVQKADAYFHVLKRFPLPVVIAKADTWLQTETKFPKPAEWAGVVPRRERVPLRQLTTAEAQEWLDAEQRLWERAPCGCALCVQAGVQEKPQRFVPEADRDERDVRVQMGDRAVTAGHWAHGSELAGFYRARGDFWNAMVERGLTKLSDVQTAERKKVPFQERLAAIFATRS